MLRPQHCTSLLNRVGCAVLTGGMLLCNQQRVGYLHFHGVMQIEFNSASLSKVASDHAGGGCGWMGQRQTAPDR